MPKRIKFTLSDEQERELKAAAKSDKRAEVRQRAPALRMLSQGHKPQVVAQAFSISEVTVYGWWHRYQRDGVAGLANQPKGRPPVQADAAYFEQLETALAQEPSAYGYDFAIWTVERLRDHLQQRTGVFLSVGHLRDLMRQRGYVYRRPKHDLASLQDREAKQSAHLLLEELKRGQAQVLTNSSLWTKRP
jgi:transposase